MPFKSDNSERLPHTPDDMIHWTECAHCGKIFNTNHPTGCPVNLNHEPCTHSNHELWIKKTEAK